jgi:hypothetical protein
MSSLLYVSSSLTTFRSLVKEDGAS